MKWNKLLSHLRPELLSEIMRDMGLPKTNDPVLMKNTIKTITEMTTGGMSNGLVSSVI